MREKYESLSAAALRDLAKARGVKGLSGMKKADIIEAMLGLDEQETEKKTEEVAVTEKEEVATEVHYAQSREPKERGEGRIRPEAREYSRDSRDYSQSRESIEGKGVRRERVYAAADRTPLDTEGLMAMDGLIPARGILEVMGDGYGFIRSDNYMPGNDDVYVSQSQIKKFNLKTGDVIVGKRRFNNPGDKFAALLLIESINNCPPEATAKRPNFEDLTPIFPNERIRLERQNSSVAMRIVDLVSPIGKGQRGMIVSPPKAGKTTLLKEIATSVNYSHPEMHLIILLIDERPEEVTDMKDTMRNSSNVEVVYSTFDESPEHHKRVSEMAIERAKRLVEHGQDVLILLDSITRLSRAYNLTVQPSGRTLSGGLDPAALHMPKRFFGAARNMREGGSLTILATALVDTGSKMDDVVFEEFKGTGNMEVVLDRKLQEKRVFPAIDIPSSGTRREDLLLTQKERDAVDIMRKAINGMRKDEAVENMINMFAHTKSNDEYTDLVIRKRML